MVGSRIVVDLSETEFIDSSGLGALIAGLKIARKAGGDLCIAAPTQQVCTVLELTTLTGSCVLVILWTALSMTEYAMEA